MAAEDAAVVVTLRANLKDYETALKSAVRATERAATQAEKAVSGIGRKAQAAPIAGAFKQSTAQMANDARVLQFQLNDIFSGIASGQGIRAVQQQLGQIAQQLGGGGLAAGARTLGAAMLGMVNPINLAVVAFGLAATAAASFFSDTGKSSAEAAKALETIADQLDAIAKRYSSSELFRKIADDARRQADAAQAVIDKQNELNRVYEAADGLVGELSGTMVDLASALQLAGADATIIDALTAANKNLTDAIGDRKVTAAELKAVEDALAAAQKTGIPLAADYATAYAKIADAFKLAAEQGKEVQDTFTRANQTMLDFFQSISGPLGGFVLAMRQLAGLDLGKLPGLLAGAGGALSGTAAEAVTATPSAAKEFLKTRAASDKVRSRIDQMDDAFATALAKLFQSLPSSAQILSGVRTKAEQQAIRDSGVRPAAPAGHSRHERGAAVDISGVDADVLERAVEATKELETLRRIGDPMHVQMAGTQKKADEAAADAAEKKAEAAARATQNIADYLTKLDEQASLEQRIAEIKMSSTLSDADKARAIAVETELQTALNLAKENGKTLSEQEIAQIRAATLAKTEAKIATDAYTKSQQDNVQAAQQFSQQIAGMAQSAIGGLINDLRNGVDAGEAFNNALSRILDSLIQISLQSLFSPQGLGGVLGGLLGAPVAHSGGIVGNASMPRRRVDPRVFVGAKHFASGGLVGGEVPIIAHRGELVIPKNMVGRGGGIGGVTNHIGSIGVSVNTGPDRTVATTEDGKKLGIMIDRAAQAVIVRESRPGGLLRKVPS
jgi:Prophage tail length tape measure protein